jgi:hypothetical protein
MATVYEIRIEGQIDACWSEWLEGMKITPLETGETVLAGEVVDQAALFGLLNRIRDMNLRLICVESKEDLH